MFLSICTSKARYIRFFAIDAFYVLLFTFLILALFHLLLVFCSYRMVAKSHVLRIANNNCPLVVYYRFRIAGTGKKDQPKLFVSRFKAKVSPQHDGDDTHTYIYLATLAIDVSLQLFCFFINTTQTCFACLTMSITISRLFSFVLCKCFR